MKPKSHMVRQAGLSMLELLIALAIGSFLILGITQVYLDNRVNYLFQQTQANNLSNSRFVTLVLDELLGKAGYRRVPDQEMFNAFPSVAASTNCQAFPVEAVVTPLASAAETGFCMRYQPAEHNELVCDGTRATLPEHRRPPFKYAEPEDLVYVAVRFVPDASRLNGGILSCTRVGGTGGAAELLDGIADFQIQFAAGFENEKRLRSSNPYKNAAEWGASDGAVRAISYSVLIASGGASERVGDSAVLQDWLSRHATAGSSARINTLDNNHVYQVATGSQALRNMMP